MEMAGAAGRPASETSRVKVDPRSRVRPDLSSSARVGALPRSGEPFGAPGGADGGWTTVSWGSRSFIGGGPARSPGRVVGQAGPSRASRPARVAGRAGLQALEDGEDAGR